MKFTGIDAPTLTGTGPGAFAFQRNDGLWVIVRGGSTINTCAALTGTQIYNPVSNRIATGPVLSAAAQRGAHAIPRPDGTWLIVHGGNVTTTSIYRENAGAYTAEAGGPVGVFLAGPALITAANGGSISFQKDNGRFVTINGNAGTVAHEYDAGWVANGVYRTEQFNLGSQLGTDSTLTWRANTLTGISAEVKTSTSQAGLQTAAAREVAKPGALISSGASDTWLQINFNFVRKFPSYGGIYTDTWYNSGASFSYPIRKIDTPILYEYKVTKDKDIIDLQSDGLSVFRVSSSGDVYTQVGGTINTSGADLAERYTSQEPLDFGEVVSIDPENNHGVKLTNYQYQPDVLGVVSTDPGFVAGAYTKDSYPIALVGRVPVKVSTENGMIYTGDSLTSASIKGHAMKATLAGRVIGKALESLDETKLVDCPASDIYLPNRKCGTIMMFVNLIDYSGASVDSSMQEWKERQLKQKQLELEGELNGLTIETDSLNSLDQNSQTKLENQFVFRDSRSIEIMAFLEALKKERELGMGSRSEIFTDKVSATGEVISPKVIAGILEARKGNFGDIDGLNITANNITAKKIVTNTISSPEGEMEMKLLPDGRLVLSRISNGTSTESTSLSSTLSSSSTDESVLAAATTTTATDDIVISFNTSGDAYFAGEVIATKVTAGALDVSGPAKFLGGLEVSTLGNASTSINILSDTFFFGRPYFTSDTGGSAIIKVGARSVDITFDREYIETPIINASMVFATTTTDESIENIFNEDVRFVITKRSTTGFTIVLNKASTENITFNWNALQVTNSKEFSSRTSVTPIEVVIPAPVVSATSTESDTISNSTSTQAENSDLNDESVSTSTPVQSIIEETVEVLSGENSSDPINPNLDISESASTSESSQPVDVTEEPGL